MIAPRSDLRVQLDQIVGLYAQALDDRNFKDLADLFEPDAGAEYSGGAVLRGQEAIVQYARRVEVAQLTQHFLHVNSFEQTEEGVKAEVYGTAVAVQEEVATVRGLRYTLLLRSTQGFRVQHLIQHALWSFTTVAELRPGALFSEAWPVVSATISRSDS